MTIVVIGSSSPKSIGYAIAEHSLQAGMHTVITTRRKKFLDKLLDEGFDARFLDFPLNCEAIDSIPDISGVVFCLAKTDITELRQGLSASTAENFDRTMNTNCYALIDLTRRMRLNLSEKCSVIALTFLGASTVVPGYGLMGVAKAALEQTIRTLAWELGPSGIRVNGISAGPLATTASRALHGFNHTAKAMGDNSCLRRNVSHAEIARTARWLLSEESGGITGEIISVDCGASHAVLNAPSASYAF